MDVPYLTYSLNNDFSHGYWRFLAASTVNTNRFMLLRDYIEALFICHTSLMFSGSLF